MRYGQFQTNVPIFGKQKSECLLFMLFNLNYKLELNLTVKFFAVSRCESSCIAT